MFLKEQSVAIHWKSGDGLSRGYHMVGASQVVLAVKNLPVNAGDVRETGSIPGLGRCPGGGHGNPLQYSCLQNPMDGGAWGATVHSCKEFDMTEVTWHASTTCLVNLLNFRIRCVAGLLLKWLLWYFPFYVGSGSLGGLQNTIGLWAHPRQKEEDGWWQSESIHVSCCHPIHVFPDPGLG